MGEKKSYIKIEKFNNETGKLETIKAEWNNEEGVEEYLHSTWNENKCRQRDYGKQESKKDRELPPEERYAYDHDRMPRCVSMENIIDGGGEGHLPYTGDFADDYAEIKDETDKLSILDKALETLTDEEKNIFHHYYENHGSDRGFEQLYGTKKTTAGRHHRELLERLRKMFRSAGYDI